jgi:methyl-accepting chemotaxis protein
VHDAYTEMTTLRLLVASAALRHQINPGLGTLELETATGNWEREAQQTANLIDNARRSITQFQASATNISRREAWISVDSILGQAESQLRQIRIDTEAAFVSVRAGNDQQTQAEAATLVAEGTALDRLMTQASGVLADGILAAILAAIVITLLIRRSIAGPLHDFVTLAERIGDGDLSARARVGGASEFGRLGGAINRMVDGLRLIASQNRDATGNLNVSVAEIRASTQQQAAGVEQQLAAVQETAATVDEIAHSGAQITRRAQEVIASAQATTQVSENGLRAVLETGRAMEQIQVQGEAVAANIVSLSEKTQAIGEIVDSVNDISERSHLLALNAAIEAASAGEHGRSFAVVATEMKILADQAREATVQVRAILGDIQRGINTSVMLTEEAVKRGAAGRERTQTAEATIEEMAAGIQDAVQTFQQIVASTNQQQLGIEQVMVALANIRQASQQTASGTRQLDSAALGLGDLARDLLATAEKFRI